MKVKNPGKSLELMLKNPREIQESVFDSQYIILPYQGIKLT